jgi:hypothetical protein
MATNFPNTVLDLEQLRESIIKNLPLMPAAEKFLASLDTALTKVRALNTHRATLIADKQKATQDLKAAVAEAQNLAIDVRAVIRGEVGSRSEKLVEFGVAPLRRRASRKAKPAEEAGAAKSPK